MSTGLFQTKIISFHGTDRIILVQTDDGPCPLLAIANILSMRGELEFPHREYVSLERLFSLLGEALMELNPTEDDGSAEDAEIHKRISIAMEMLPRLMQGMDVNIRFNSIRGFEAGRESVTFEMFKIPLVHGWLVDPECDQYEIVSLLSYDELTAVAVDESPENAATAYLCQKFLAVNQNQLTPYGLEAMHRDLDEGELVVFFQNNHFTTVEKNEGALYMLVSDSTMAHVRDDSVPVVWEKLDHIEFGACTFCDAEYNILANVPTRQEAIRRRREHKRQRKRARALRRKQQQEEAELRRQFQQQRKPDLSHVHGDAASVPPQNRQSSTPKTIPPPPQDVNSDGDDGPVVVVPARMSTFGQELAPLGDMDFAFEDDGHGDPTQIVTSSSSSLTDMQLQPNGDSEADHSLTDLEFARRLQEEELRRSGAGAMGDYYGDHRLASETSSTTPRGDGEYRITREDLCNPQMLCIIFSILAFIGLTIYVSIAASSS